ncbi:molybdenum ABC transporter ATP-binding protein [Salinisphaera sp.]|uniref:molybdenum ABC transporter ATP-binding protein n=1 Tax=Salinisphaera sp. TaxID=1914330 RepID=UPI000C5C3EB3|nr:molybdenum ABC transporter ATP-binding protein [Salinisphaera sp.]MBS61931.1 molybdenum ABC transporter ATP-binding protein [Salinisphaera sp.]
MLSIDIAHRQGDFTLECAFDSDARVTGLFGPSGAGKSSLLRIIAGLVRPDRGRVELAGRCVFDSQAGVHVPAHRRRIGYVFQRARLFAHLNVRHNLGYGAWFAREKPVRARFEQVVDMLDIGPLLGRRIHGLSGGEQQRVAIGRALLSNPAMLLLDEPLASLDVARRQEVLPYIERLSAESELPILFVSHQLDELLRLANRRVVAIRDGRVTFSGPTAEFLAQPALLGAEQARDAGVLLRGEIVAHVLADGLTELACGGQLLYVPQVEHAAGAEITLHVRARDVMLARERPQDISALNVLEARIERLANDGDYAVNVQMRVGEQPLEARITRRSAQALALAPGQTVHAVIKSLALAEQAWERLGGL